MDSGFLIKRFDSLVYMGIKHRAIVDIVSAAPITPTWSTASLPPLRMLSANVPSLESVNEKMETLEKARPWNSLAFHADGILLSGFNRIYRWGWSIFGSVNSCIHSCSWADSSALSHEVQTLERGREKGRGKACPLKKAAPPHVYALWINICIKVV